MLQDEVDGAWAPGKASLSLLTSFMHSVQDNNVEEAESTAEKSEFWDLGGEVAQNWWYFFI